MNKKIYFNHKFIALSDGKPPVAPDTDLVTSTAPDDAELERIIRRFLDVSDPHSFYLLLNEDHEEFLRRLKPFFSYIEAAGGVIQKGKELLCIHRHGRWDLPKGKLEKGETVEVAAVRECEEECGVKDLEIVQALPSTFHVYPYKGGYALKQTYWFYMRTDYDKALVPQLEEDIHEVRWFSRKDIESTVLTDTYYTISDTLIAALILAGSKI